MRKYASIGSTIQTTFSDGRVQLWKVTTEQACAVANELIMSGRWTLVENDGFVARTMAGEKG